MSDLADRLENEWLDDIGIQKIRKEAANRLRKLEAVRVAADALVGMVRTEPLMAVRLLKEALAACGDDDG